MYRLVLSKQIKEFLIQNNRKLKVTIKEQWGLSQLNLCYLHWCSAPPW